MSYGCNWIDITGPQRKNLQSSKDKFTIHSKAVVCQDVELKGDITIGSGKAFLAIKHAHSSKFLPDFAVRILISTLVLRHGRPSKGHDHVDLRSNRHRDRMHH